MSRTPAGDPRQRRERSPLGLLWFVAGAVVALVAIMVFPSVRNALRKTESTTVQQAKSLGHRLAKTPPAEPGTAAAHFDFYRILAHPAQILTSTESGEVSEEPATQPVAQPGHYVLQVASFRADSDAEALKAQLALWGVTANVESVNVQGETWHRVRVGPVSDLPTLNAVRKKLALHHLHPLLIRLGS